MKVRPTMKAFFVEQVDGPFVSREVATPVPAPNEVLVRIAASGVNPLDTKIRAGKAAHAHHPFPAVLGMDMAGTVVAVGANVAGFKVGDQVFGVTGGVGGIQGSLAEYAAVDADLLAHKPNNLSMREAAALPLVFITAWEGLVDRAKVDFEKTVLVHGGAGGVGHVAVQIAKAFGADVYATVSSGDMAIVSQYGAVPIDYKTHAVDDYLEQYTNGDGFDIVYDTVGGSTLDASFAAAKIYRGHVVSCLGWGTHALAPLSFKGATYSGVFTLLPLLSGLGRRHHGEILAEAAKLVESGQLKVRVDERNFSFDQIEDAHALISSGKPKGKVIITEE